MDFVSLLTLCLQYETDFVSFYLVFAVGNGRFSVSLPCICSGNGRFQSLYIVFAVGNGRFSVSLLVFAVGNGLCSVLTLYLQ